MNEFNLENYRSAWRNEPAFGGPGLKPDQVEAVLRRESRNTSRQFRTALWLDIVLKSLAVAALLGLVFLYRDNATATALHAFVLAFTLFLLFLQWNTLRAVPPDSTAGTSLRDCMMTFVRFYRDRFLRSLYVGAVTGALVFYTGSFYYSWFKYGGLRALEADDYAVFITGLLLAFGINALAQRWQANFQVGELEACLEEIDEESLTAQSQRRRKFRRRKVSLTWLVFLVLGILVLLYFVAL